MAQTTLQLMNRVLGGLRKDALALTTTSVTEQYHLLLLQTLNRAKEMCEEAWDWAALRVTVTIPTIASTTSYALVTPAATVSIRSTATLLYEKVYGAWLPQIWVTNGTAVSRLRERPVEEIQRDIIENPTITGIPSDFALSGNADNRVLLVYPVPSAAYTITARFVNPQVELPNSLLSTTELTIPHRPVWLLALYLMNEERGEELGTPGASLQSDANWALAEAISREQTDDDITGTPE